MFTQKRISNKSKIARSKLLSVIPVPSKAIDCMIRVFYDLIKGRSNLTLSFADFGCSIGNKCYGCVATGMLQDIYKKKFNSSNINGRHCRANYLNIPCDALYLVESMFNGLRLGHIWELGWLYDDNVMDRLTDVLEGKGYTPYTCISELEFHGGDTFEEIKEKLLLWKDVVTALEDKGL